MKQKTFLCAMFAALFLTMSACGASSANSAMDTAAAEPAMETMKIEGTDGGTYDDDAAAEGEMDTEETTAGAVQESESALLAGSGISESDLAEKIIYSAVADLETQEFDSSVQKIYALMEQYGAFLENSYFTDEQLLYDGYQRYGSFTLRVPQEHYSDFTGALDGVGHITSLRSSAENITAQYTDTQSRLNAYETEEQRLLEIMAQAETVEDLITLENRLSEIRYQKESLTAQLQNWDNQISYSTVTLSLYEVQELTPEPPEEEPTYLEQLGQTFMGSVHWMGRAAKGGVKLLVAVIPVLLPIAVIILAVVLICKAASKRKLRKQEKVLQNQRKENEHS